MWNSIRPWTWNSISYLNWKKRHHTLGEFSHFPFKQDGALGVIPCKEIKIPMLSSKLTHQQSKLNKRNEYSSCVDCWFFSRWHKDRKVIWEQADVVPRRGLPAGPTWMRPFPGLLCVSSAWLHPYDLRLESLVTDGKTHWPWDSEEVIEHNCYTFQIETLIGSSAQVMTWRSMPIPALQMIFLYVCAMG